jgi:hypothetical protein
MLKYLFGPTPVMSADSHRQKIVYSILVLLVALGQFVCASGSGSATGPDAVSGGVHTAMNVANTLIGILVLIPRTRALGATLSAVILTMSMLANAVFYGRAYFLALLPFDGGVFVLSCVVAVHYWRDLARPFASHSTAQRRNG